MFLRRCKPIVLFVFSIYTGLACAQSIPRQLSLDELFTLGVEHSMTVKGSQVLLGIAKSNLSDRKTVYFPSIGIGLNAGYTGYGSASGVNQNYSIELREPIYAGSRVRHSVALAQIDQQSAQTGIERDVASVKLSLAECYLDLISLYKQQQSIEQSIEQARQRLRDIQAMERKGMVTRSDVLRSELQLSQYELTLSGVHNEIEIISTELDIALGLDEGLIIAPDTSIIDRPLPQLPYDQYISAATQRYPELRIMEDNVLAAKEQSHIVRADYFPELSMRASNTLATPQAVRSGSLSNTWNASIALSYNISSLYSNRHKVKAADLSVTYAQNEMERATRELRARIKGEYLNHTQALKRVATLEISVHQAEENYRIVLNKYTHQMAILTDLLDASALELDSRLQLTRAKTEATKTYFHLLRSSGEL